MRIAVDVDGVLADRVAAILEYLESAYDVSLTKREVTGWDVTVPATGKRFPEFFAETDPDRDHVVDIDPVPGAVEAMRALARDHELVIATYRAPAARAATIEWLERHDIPYHEYARDVGHRKRAVAADLLVDDSPDTAREYARHHDRAILFDQPWNRDADLPANVDRADSWPDVLDHIRRRARD